VPNEIAKSANAAEKPRHVIVSARVSPMVELTRWLFERYRVPYHEEPHAPVLHVLATRRRGGGVEVPVVVGPEGLWDGARSVLVGLDAKSRPGERLFGEAEDERLRNRALIERLLDLLLRTVRRFVYFHMLPLKSALYPIAVDGAPAWERGFVFLFYGIWRRLMARGLDFSPPLLAKAPDSIREACEMVERELEKRGTPFLGGDAPDAADIVFAALMAPVVLPTGYGAKLPPISALPPALKDFVAEMQARRAGHLVMETYRAARTQTQPPLPARGSGRPLASILFGPAVQRLAARLAVAYGRVLRFRTFAVASRSADVAEVFRRDLDFRIAPINGPRIDEVSGQFVLGLDRGATMAAERPRLYAAMSATDLGAVRTLIAREAARLLDAAAAGGRLDVVNGYARLVAARTARELFGVAGPTEADLMRVVRAVFHHIFLNLGADAQVRERALAASLELRNWVEAEIRRRRAGTIREDDVLGRLMWPGEGGPPALDDDGVRRNLSGLLVGSIDTTASSVGKIIAVICADAGLQRRVERDLDDPRRMAAWCDEALRLWPHNPIVLRQAAADVTLGSAAVPSGTTVVAFTQAAMMDPSRFPQPTRLDPSRSPSLYLHHGGGLHPCAGRAVNRVQIPELVRRILERQVVSVSRPRFDGPFIDELVVTFGKSAR
jgi:cytochrome P450/glutathione S-transferase